MLYIDNKMNVLWINRTPVPMQTITDNHPFLQVAMASVQMKAGEEQTLYTSYVDPFKGRREGKHTLDWFIDELARAGVQVAVRLGLSSNDVFTSIETYSNRFKNHVEYRVLDDTCLPLVTRFDPLKAPPLVLEFRLSKSYVSRVLQPRMSERNPQRIGSLTKRSLTLRR